MQLSCAPAGILTLEKAAHQIPESVYTLSVVVIPLLRGERGAAAASTGGGGGFLNKSATKSNLLFSITDCCSATRKSVFYTITETSRCRKSCRLYLLEEARHGVRNLAGVVLDHELQRAKSGLFEETML